MVLSALGFLVAFTLRDFIAELFATMISPKDSLFMMFAYTLVIFIVALVVTISLT